MKSPCRHPQPRGCWIKAATAARRAALEILRAVRAGTPLDAARDRHLSGLAERDRRLAYELSAGVLRQQRELDHALDLDRADPRLHDVLRLGAYQLRHLTRVPAHAAVSTSVELARRTVGEGSTGYVNHALRKLQRETGSGKREADATHPDWLIKRWIAQFGEQETQRLAEWNDTRPTLVLQPARWNLERLEAALSEAGMATERAPFEAGLVLRFPLPVSRIPGFAEGAFIVQDPAHALVVRFASVPAGTLVYDACAAPGGKAVALEAAGARVLAGDARHERIGRLADTTRRAGVAIHPLAANLEAAPIGPGRVDAVLVDAPCSATGTMRRHPDARWRLHPAVFTRSAQRQRRLLEAAAPLVRHGGLLIYATCSLEPEENEQVVEEFLNQHPEFARAPRSESVPAELLTVAGDFQSLPQRDGIDGAYAARLVRAS
ncbi:MAG TPA: 16S rRNA (cytosine(967)-C(5))-methyltransferase RsmB [Gemmatimonadales bacterium]|nr:16S rRNA (cytosine(967)-C(5))-methyltransferase RsmB [Gemmatimonadales bacterium]